MAYYVKPGFWVTAQTKSSPWLNLNNLISSVANNNLSAGSNITITGTGTVADPYIITAAGGSSFSTEVSSALTKTTPVDGDLLGLVDSEDSSNTKGLDWLNVKATLKTYFDTLYGGLPYSSYNALLDHNGAFIVPEVLSNNLGNTVSFAQLFTGIYAATIPGGFTPGKVQVFITNGKTFGTEGYYQAYSDGVDAIWIEVRGVDGVLADIEFGDTSIEIRVYP